MSYENISSLSMAGMIVSLVISFVFPLGIMLYLLIKRKAKISSFFIGCGVFLVFAFILESIFHSIVSNLTGDFIRQNLFITAIYGGLCAALFEETGRFIAMKRFMKNKLTSDNALMYGVGHGGIEAMIIVGLTEVTNIAISSMINAGQIDVLLNPLDESVRLETYNSLSSLWTTSSDLFFLAGIERVLAILGHIAMSYLVFMAVKYAEKKCLAIAYGFHFILDASSVIVNSLVSNVYVTEFVILIMDIAIIYITIYFKNQLNVDVDEEV